MTTLSIITLKNSETNIHRIFVTLKGIEEENVEFYGLLIQRSRQLYRGFYKRKNKLKTRVLEYSFNKKKTSFKGDQTFVIEIINATTEDCRIYASMIYSCIICNFDFDEELYKVKTLNTDFTDVITEPDVVNEMLKEV